MPKRTTTLAVAGALAAAYAGWQYGRRGRLRKLTGKIRPGQSIVIVGPGFAGTCAARCLGRMLPPELNIRITLIDQRNYLLFTPMLSEVAGGELDPVHIVASPHTISAGVDFLQAVVEEIDLKQKRVTIGVGADRRTLRADYIVIAVGSVTDFHHVPGAEERSFTLKSLDDATRLQMHAIEMLELASIEPDQEKRRTLLTFVVAGFTGVETIGCGGGLWHPLLRPGGVAPLAHDLPFQNSRLAAAGSGPVGLDSRFCVRARDDRYIDRETQKVRTPGAYPDAQMDSEISRSHLPAGGHRSE